MKRALSALLVSLLLGITAPGQVRVDTASGEKIIQDPKEYDAYEKAVMTRHPGSKSVALEAFAKQYPNSVVLEDVFERAMKAYQELNDAARVEDAARRILQLNPRHVEALAWITYVSRDRFTFKQPDNALLVTICNDSKVGLQALASWPRPNLDSAEEFERRRRQLAGVFAGGAGLCALQGKDFPEARDLLTKAIQLDSDFHSSVVDNFQRAQADLEPNPMEVKGFWYCGRAVLIATQSDNSAISTVGPYCAAKYKAFHGSEDGWDRIVQGTFKGAAPPSDFNIVSAATSNKPRKTTPSSKKP